MPNFGINVTSRLGARLYADGWLVGGFKADSLTWYLGLWVECPQFGGGLSKGSYPLFMRVLENHWKTPNGNVDKRD